MRNMESSLVEAFRKILALNLFGCWMFQCADTRCARKELKCNRTSDHTNVR